MNQSTEIDPSIPTVTLSQLSAALAPAKIDGAGLDELGIKVIGYRQKGKNAKYYHANEVTRVRALLIAKWQAAPAVGA